MMLSPELHDASLMRTVGQQPMPAKQEFNEGRWSKEEHQLFVQGLELYGKEWKKIAQVIPSRSIVQIRTHAQKFFQKIARVNFEKRGRQVPDALKSTAIKSSYNFQSLQQALNEHSTTGASTAPAVKKECKSAGNTPTAGRQIGDFDRPQIERSESSSSEETIRRGRASRQDEKARSRRSRRKSSRFSVDLRELSLKESDVEEPDFGMTFDRTPMYGTFSLYDDRYADNLRQKEHKRARGPLFDGGMNNGRINTTCNTNNRSTVGGFSGRYNTIDYLPSNPAPTRIFQQNEQDFQGEDMSDLLLGEFSFGNTNDNANDDFGRYEGQFFDNLGPLRENDEEEFDLGIKEEQQNRSNGTSSTADSQQSNVDPLLDLMNSSFDNILPEETNIYGF